MKEHMTPVHHEPISHGKDGLNIGDHAHPMHKGPHHDMLIHPHNRGAEKGYVKEKHSTASYEGHLKQEDIAGHDGKMFNKQKNG